MSQRLHERRVIDVPVSVAHAGDADAHGFGTIRFDTLDLSVGGAFLRSDLLLDLGEELAIEFQLPNGPHVTARARVVHVAHDPGEKGVAGMGIAFVEIADHHREAVRAFLAEGLSPEA